MSESYVFEQRIVVMKYTTNGPSVSEYDVVSDGMRSSRGTTGPVGACTVVAAAVVAEWFPTCTQTVLSRTVIETGIVVGCT